MQNDKKIDQQIRENDRNGTQTNENERRQV